MDNDFYVIKLTNNTKESELTFDVYGEMNAREAFEAAESLRLNLDDDVDVDLIDGSTGDIIKTTYHL